MDDDMPIWHDSFPVVESLHSSKKRTVSVLLNDDQELLLQPEAPISPLLPDNDVAYTDGEHSILIGALPDINARLTRNDGRAFPQKPAPDAIESCGEKTAVILEVKPAGAYLELYYEDRKIALLNKETCKVLHSLCDQGLQVKAFLAEKEWSEVRDCWNSKRWTSDLAIFRVELNLYCRSTQADPFGKVLSKGSLFLQRPFFDTYADYLNPHVYSIPGLIPTPITAEIEIISENEDDSFSEGNESSAPRSRQKRRGDLNTVLDSLDHAEIQVQVRAGTDQRLKTEIMPHQRKATDFIIQRETGNVTSDLTMWKENTEDAAETFYQHIFTGARRPQRDEILGGILADDMGLGKSLTLLYTVASSASRAKAFKDRTPPNLLAQGRYHSKATLVLAPSTLLIDSWIDERHRHFHPGYLSFFKYLGSDRHDAHQALLNHDIVFTTYATVAKDKGNDKSPLKQIVWFRLVLDEAHEIRNRSTRQYEAVHALSAHHRWCLTGTPIQNTLDDLSSLITFLRVPMLEKSSTFRNYITKHTLSGRRDAFKNLQTLLRTICIRRTRESIGLPDPEPQICYVDFSVTERAAYDSLWDDFRRDVQKAVSGRQAKMASTALRCIHELRLFCNNGPRRNNKSDQTDDERLSILEALGKNKCAKCKSTVLFIDRHDDGQGGVFMPSCDHLVCNGCAPPVHGRSVNCQFCKDHIPTPDLSSAPESDIGQEAQEPPSKLKNLLADIKSDVKRKCIVFSSWKKTLDIVTGMAEAESLRSVMIHGSLSLNKRKQVLDSFRSDAGPNILLMTLGTGAVGLNLAVASRIYLLEPQWNPFLEYQAMARALRIGQDHQVDIIRFITRRTIESSSVLGKQKTKTELAGGGFSKTKLKGALELFGVDHPAADFAVEDAMSIDGDISEDEGA